MLADADAEGDVVQGDVGAALDGDVVELDQRSGVGAHRESSILLGGRIQKSEHRMQNWNPGVGNQHPEVRESGVRIDAGSHKCVNVKGRNKTLESRVSVKIREPGR